MFDKKDVFCEITKATVRVWCQTVARGAKRECRFLRCESSQKCPRSTFCRFVNPLTTRVPVTPPAAAPATPTRPASASTRMPPVADRPAAN